MGRPFKCPYCGSSDTVSKGVRKTKTMGSRLVRRCRACKRKFTPKNQQGGADTMGPAAPEQAEEVARDEPCAPDAPDAPAGPAGPEDTAPEKP